MRCLTRMGLGLLGLALVAAPSAWADPPRTSLPIGAGAAARPRRSLFHTSHLCAECQRAQLLARGINIPPPPPLPPGEAHASKPCDRCGAVAVSRSALGSTPATMAAPGGNCATCAAGANGMPMMAANGAMAGHAVVGGNSPGYAAIGGAIPTDAPMPIGVIQGRYAYQNPSAGIPTPGGRPGVGTRGPGTADPAVMPTSMAPQMYAPSAPNRPHIASHLFHLDTIGRRGREEPQRRERESHAAISYQPQNQPVNELPASMVYSR